MNRIQLIQQVIPLLYIPVAEKRKNRARSSYGLKHEVEQELDFYITNQELIDAMVGLGFPHKVGDPNYTFYVCPLYPSSIHQYAQLPSRPKGVWKKHWEHYHYAQKQIRELVNSLIQHDTSDDSRFTKLARVVGHHS